MFPSPIYAHIYGPQGHYRLCLLRCSDQPVSKSVEESSKMCQPGIETTDRVQKMECQVLIVEYIKRSVIFHAIFCTLWGCT